MVELCAIAGKTFAENKTEIIIRTRNDLFDIISRLHKKEKKGVELTTLLTNVNSSYNDITIGCLQVELCISSNLDLLIQTD